jgi:UDP-N-acetylmuramoyl-tripeptide--D-alanyl-D-alanine ligase
VRFRLNGRKVEVFVPLLGKHTALTRWRAMAVARKCGVFEEQVVHNLSTATGPEMRLQLQQVNGVTLLNDAYNANPNSMIAALETIASLPEAGTAHCGPRRDAELGESGPALAQRGRRVRGHCGLGPAGLRRRRRRRDRRGARAAGLRRFVKTYPDLRSAAARS